MLGILLEFYKYDVFIVFFILNIKSVREGSIFFIVWVIVLVCYIYGINKDVVF